VQKQIWIDVGGKLDYGEDIYAATEAFIKFGDQVGWRKGSLEIEDLIGNISTDFPRGYLPGREVNEKYKFGGYKRESLFSRIQTCRL